MPLHCGTHSGGFHADDVLALALIRVFRDNHATVVRSRDTEVLAACDVVFDVGGEHDPERGRFDHHQVEYRGPLSSAGMVLDWLESEGDVDPEVAAQLRIEIVDYVDEVDNGRRTPEAGVPCFASVVGMMTNDTGDGTPMDDRYSRAVELAQRCVDGIRAGFEEARNARTAVERAMRLAVEAGRRVLFLHDYVPWKSAYFDLGGAEHPTDFVLFPAEGRWRIYAIPPEPASFDKKVPFPAEWAGLTDGDLEGVVGVPGARFCHKNRFIAVFDTREGAIEALRKWRLDGVE